MSNNLNKLAVKYNFTESDIAEIKTMSRELLQDSDFRQSCGRVADIRTHSVKEAVSHYFDIKSALYHSKH